MESSFGRASSDPHGLGKECMLCCADGALANSWSGRQSKTKQNSFKTVQGVSSAVSHPPVSRRSQSTEVYRGSSVVVPPGEVWQEEMI